MTKEQRREVMDRLNGPNMDDAFEAKAIWNDSVPALERPLIRTLKHGRRAFNREAAAFAMTMVTTSRTIAALERVVDNKAGRPRVRGEAAEALTHTYRPGTPVVLMRTLGDPSKELRFWCSYALGEMGEKRGTAALERFAATDHRFVRGFHSVSPEAADAVRQIRERKRRCPFRVHPRRLEVGNRRNLQSRG
jgi:HEAT repeat protein